MLRVRATEKRPNLAVEKHDYARKELLVVTTSDAGVATNVSRQRSYNELGRAASASDEAKRNVYAP